MFKRVELLHGVNMDHLAGFDERFGLLTLDELEAQMRGWGRELGLDVTCFNTNDEALFIQRLHSLRGRADGIVINAGAWGHYSWAVSDALAIAGVPTVEVHLSDTSNREEWRRSSTLRDCIAVISGKGPAGYREGLEILAQTLHGELDETQARSADLGLR
jgi:3-dehydroquinate dehydratase-2